MKGKGVKSMLILNLGTSNLMEILQHTPVSSCQPLGVTKGFYNNCRGKAPAPAAQSKFFQRKFWKKTWRKFKGTSVRSRGYPQSEIDSDNKLSLWYTFKKSTPTKIFPRKNHYALCHAISILLSVLSLKTFLSNSSKIERMIISYPYLLLTKPKARSGWVLVIRKFNIFQCVYCELMTWVLFTQCRLQFILCKVFSSVLLK